MSAPTYRPRRSARHESRVIRGLECHLTCWGSPDGSPIVLLHGWMDTGATFQFLVDEMSDRWSFVAPDWRGFGRSAWAPEGYWFPNYLADLDALLEIYSRQTPATLVGHSMGGNVASLYAGVRPERVRRLVNIEGLGLPRTAADQAPARYRRWLEELGGTPTFSTYASFEQFAQFLAGRNPRLDLARARFIAEAWSERAADGTITIRSDPQHKLVNPVLYRREEAEACWRNITARVLLLLGGLSEFRGRLGEDSTDQRLHAAFRDVRMATVADAGHMMHHERPREVAQLIESFLADEGTPA
ncbi:MAG TPA: alpha/beta hydrolase [Steroidobacteraceae bacterium]|nr:alpha/beta hydrolase [Steroidobacteraceae bacterium]